MTRFYPLLRRFVMPLGILLLLFFELPQAWGQSAFEDFISANGGVIPYPIEELAQSLIQNKVVERIHAVQIPDGRSLQKEHANYENPRVVFGGRKGNDDPSPPPVFVAFTPSAKTLEIQSFDRTLGKYVFLEVLDYAPGQKPRVERPDRKKCETCHQAGGPILSHFPWAETDEQSKYIGSLILKAKWDRASREAQEIWKKRGYSTRCFEKNDDLEASHILKVLVKSFFTVDPIRARFRELLLKCAGEVSKKDAVALTNEVVAELTTKLGKYDEILHPNGLVDQHIFGYPIAGRNAFGLDRLVRIANNRLQARRVCDSLCGSDLQCRKVLIEIAIASAVDAIPQYPPFKDSRSYRLLKSRYKRYVVPHLPPGQFAYPSSVLPDRNPLESANLGGTTLIGGKNIKTTQLFEPDEVPGWDSNPSGIGNYSEEVSRSGFMTSPGSHSEIIHGIQDRADPSYPRPLVGAIDEENGMERLGFLLPYCFDMAQRKISQEIPENGRDDPTEEHYDNLLGALIVSNKTMSRLSTWPPTRETLTSIITQAHQGRWDTYLRKKIHDLTLSMEAACEQPKSGSVFSNQNSSFVGRMLDVLSPPQVIKPSLDAKSEKVNSLLRRHCAECHDHYLKLPFDNLEEMAKYRSAKNQSVVDRLGSPTRPMPPRDFAHALSNEDRLFLIQYLDDLQ